MTEHNADNIVAASDYNSAQSKSQKTRNRFNY